MELREIKTLVELKEKIQAGFDNNEESLESFGITYSVQLKAYLIENNNKNPGDSGCPDGSWVPLDAKNWYVNKGGTYPEVFFLDKSRSRIWVIYSILDATLSDGIINTWIKNTKGLDNCWFSRNQLMMWDGKDSWSQRGIGLKFNDGLSSPDDAGNFSLKAWHGANKYIEGLDEILQSAKERFAIHSTRWQKFSEGKPSAITSEWYSTGKVTINRAVDTDEVMLHISEMANTYLKSVNDATNLRDSSMGAFELNFTQNININSFASTVLKGSGDMKLWMVETESYPDFKRFKGVDLHNWDRVFLDVGDNYAYLTIPGKGCVNAAPRLAVIQGEDNAGKTTIYHDGVELFA